MCRPGKAPLMVRPERGSRDCDKRFQPGRAGGAAFVFHRSPRRAPVRKVIIARLRAGSFLRNEVSEKEIVPWRDPGTALKIVVLSVNFSDEAVRKFKASLD